MLRCDAIKAVLAGLTTLVRRASTIVAPKSRHNPGNDEVGWLVLPSPNHGPSSSKEHLVGVIVPLSVTPNLVGPELRVSLRDCVMFGATVPETTVDEYGDSCARKDEVRSSVQRRNRAVVDAISQTCCVCGAPNDKLGLRVAPSVRLHPSADAW